MEFGKTVHFAILTQCLPAQFTAFPSVHDPFCHADSNIREHGVCSGPPLQAEGNWFHHHLQRKYLNIYYSMYTPCLIFIGKLLHDL